MPNFPDDFQDPALFFRASDSNLILTYLHRGVSRTVETILNIPRGTGGTPGQTAQQVQAAITAGIAAGVSSWALAANADTIPFTKIDLTELEKWADRQDFLPKDMEVLIASRRILLETGVSRYLDLDTDQTRPTTGISHWNIQGHVVTLDNAALEAKNAATISANIIPFPADYIEIPNAVSQFEDGNFNLSLYVGKDPDSNARYIYQLQGNTNINRQLEVTSTEDIGFLNDATFDTAANRFTFPRREGTAQQSRQITLPAYVQGIAFNAGTHVFTITERDGANTTTQTVQLPASSIPVTPTTELEPPDESYDETLAANSTTFTADADSSVIPLTGGFDVWVTPTGGQTEIVRHGDFNFETLRALAAATTATTPSASNALSVAASSGDLWVAHTAAFHILASNRGDTQARRVQIVSHYQIKAEPPETIFDLTVTASATNRLRWLEDPEATAYDPLNDGDLDYFLDGVEEDDDITPHQFGNFGTPVAGAVEPNVATAGGQGEAISDRGVLSRTADNKFVFLLYPAPPVGVADGTQVRIEVKKKPVHYVRTNALHDLVGAFLAQHQAITYNANDDTLSYAWREGDLDQAVQDKINAAATGVDTWALTANATEHIPSAKLPTQIPRANLPFINLASRQHRTRSIDLADSTDTVGHSRI